MKKKTAAEEAKRTSALSAVMAVSMLFLAAVLIRSAVVQLRAAHTFSGCISIVGAALFLLVGGMLCSDLRKKRKEKIKSQEA